MNPDYKQIVRAILDEYRLEPWGIHGLAHWARVLENGLRLAETTGADKRIVRLFALFHDSRRQNENVDDGHGRRGAEFAATLRNKLFSLPDEDYGRLIKACESHTDEIFNDNPTIQTCWDADRLDLYRVKKTVHLDYFGAAAAKSPEILAWAEQRGRARFVPDWIETAWGVSAPGNSF